MATASENSFGARLRKAQDILTYISSFSNYKPLRQEETVESLTTLINNIINANAEEKSTYHLYSSAVLTRRNAFKNASKSIEKLLSPILGNISALYGRESIEYESVNSIVKKIRSTKHPKPTEPSENEKPVETISKSERSYGSITQSFNDIINTISQFSTYEATTEDLKVTNLKLRASELTEHNNLVAKNFQLLTNIRKQRKDYYNDLAERIQRIKSYVKSKYGFNSNEYSLIKSIKI